MTGNPRFLPNVCQMCGDTSARGMLHCKYCKIISYCSEAHRELHWKIHQCCCLAFKQTLEEMSSYEMTKDVIGFVYANDQQREKALYAYASMGAGLLQNKYLKRSLTMDEKQIWIGIGRCAWCNVFNIEELQYCEDCHVVGYCKMHQDEVLGHHKDQCSALSLAVRCSKLLRCNVNQDQLPPVHIPRFLRTRSEKLPENGWTTYYTQRGFRSLENTNEIEPEAYGLMNDPLALRAIYTDFLSYPLSIAYVLENTEQIHEDNFKMHNLISLKIHIVGASLSNEFVGIQKYEEIFHLYPKLKKIVLIGIGPWIPMEMDGYTNDRSELLCTACKRNGHQLSISLHSQLYEAYARSTRYIPPNVCIAYNCGVHEHYNTPNDTWGPALKVLVENNILTIFTSLTENEVLQDSQRLENDIGAQILLSPRINPWRGGKPMRQVFQKFNVFYYNYYIFAIKGYKDTDL